jgi:hypothetical protein
MQGLMQTILTEGREGMELDIEAVRSLRLNRRTGGLQIKRRSKNGERSINNCGVATNKESVEIQRLRMCVSACKQSVLDVKMPLGILQDELFQARYWLGLERMSCVEHANRRRAMVRLFLMVVVVLCGLTSITPGSSCKTPPVQSIENNVDPYTDEEEPSAVVSEDLAEPRYHAPFILPEPVTSQKLEGEGETVRASETINPQEIPSGQTLRGAKLMTVPEHEGKDGQQRQYLDGDRPER